MLVLVVLPYFTFCISGPQFTGHMHDGLLKIHA